MPRIAGLALFFMALPCLAAEPPPARQAALVDLVRQDCGSCHGMTLKGGLGRSLLPERQAVEKRGHAAGEVSFETLRMLSTGMTKAEVLSRAGHPRHEFKNKGSQRWVYESTERWIVEIVFSGNKVIAIDWSRT